MGSDITRVVLCFLNEEMDIPKLIDTFIMLVPKVKSLKRITEYKPISLCNMVYKLIFKTITR